PMRRNFQRIATWLGISAVLWLAGGLSDGSVRWACWIFALVIEWLGPSIGFYTPGLGRSTTNDWNVEGGHMAERDDDEQRAALGHVAGFHVPVVGGGGAQARRGEA
ncbi:low temperature requirement protein A, partial [Escherichia coli]|nr:low temperature requirement protein A [Escherichia coli]